MLDNYKANLVLIFFKEDGKGDFKESRITLGNVRKNLTPEEVGQVGEAFRSLIKHPLADVEIVQFHRVV